MMSFFGKATVVTILSPVIIIALLSIYFWGMLPSIKIIVVVLITSFYLAIYHGLEVRIGSMKAAMFGLLVMILNFIILVA